MAFAFGLTLLLCLAAVLNPASREAMLSLAGSKPAAPAALPDAACERASHLAKLAWSSKEPSERYQAAADGLGELAACHDDDQIAYGEAMLMSVKTEAEFKLQLGNAPYDSRRALEKLDTCIARFRERMPKEAQSCQRNRDAIATYFRGITIHGQ